MTHSELIEALGGGTKVAERLSALSGQDVDREAVYKWKELNSIAWRWRPLVAALAEEGGHRLPDDFMPGMARPSSPGVAIAQ